MVHLEANLDRLRVQVTDANTPDRVIQIVDPAQGRVIADSRSSEPLGASRFANTSEKTMPANWQRASATLPSAPGDDLQWRVDVAMKAEGIWSAGLLLRLSALLVLGGAALMMLGVHSRIRRAEVIDAAGVPAPATTTTPSVSATRTPTPWN